MACNEIMEAVVFLFLIMSIPPVLLHPTIFHTERLDFPLLIIFGVLMLGGFGHAHQIVYGFADDGGIRYKRYFKWKSINWVEIESISRRPMGKIRVDVGRYKFFNRRLLFMRDIVLFAPVLAQTPKFHPFTTPASFAPFCPGCGSQPSRAHSCNPATPVLPITSLQPSQFHAVTHSFANGARLSPLFSTASTLFLSPRGWYPCDLCLP